MEFIHQFADLFIHLDHHISSICAHYGAWSYLILFVIIFCETGLVVTPFLPGDSLLFVLGAMSAVGDLHLAALIMLLSLAAIGGNMLNYTIGVFLSGKVINNQAVPFVKQAYIKRTHEFFEKYGAKTIIITRFVPIIRTFAPFLAGSAACLTAGLQYIILSENSVGLGGVTKRVLLWQPAFCASQFLFGHFGDRGHFSCSRSPGIYQA